MKVVSILTCALTTLVLSARSTEAAAATNAALNTLMSMDYRFFVAGGTCAAISHGITCPIDVVKVRSSSVV
jgi:solute carrier family 25 (mitochondrial phosphate transporter), member 3